jgi:hypothetical protein
LIDTWLSLPLPESMLILAGCYSGFAAILVRLSSGSKVGAWVRSFEGVVAPFIGAVAVVFGILVGFLANDVWDRNRQAASTVRMEAASLVSLHDLAASLGQFYITPVP